MSLLKGIGYDTSRIHLDVPEKTIPECGVFNHVDAPSELPNTGWKGRRRKGQEFAHKAVRARSMKPLLLFFTGIQLVNSHSLARGTGAKRTRGNIVYE